MGHAAVMSNPQRPGVRPRLNGCAAEAGPVGAGLARGVRDRPERVAVGRARSVGRCGRRRRRGVGVPVVPAGGTCLRAAGCCTVFSAAGNPWSLHGFRWATGKSATSPRAPDRPAYGAAYTGADGVRPRNPGAPGAGTGGCVRLRGRPTIGRPRLPRAYTPRRRDDRGHRSLPSTPACRTGRTRRGGGTAGAGHRGRGRLSPGLRSGLNRARSAADTYGQTAEAALPHPRRRRAAPLPRLVGSSSSQFEQFGQ